MSENKKIVSEPAMSAQQRRFSKGKLGTYKEFVSGSQGWLSFVLFEVYNLLFSWLPALPGFASRTFTLPLFLAKGSGRPTIGRGVTIRQPHLIKIAKGVIVDDYAVLDVRENDESAKEERIAIAKSCFIGRGTTVAAKGGSISLGPAVNIGSDCRIATQTSISIGESTLVAAYCYIGPGNHGKADEGKAMIEQDMELKGGVQIGEHCWIGTRATILDGVKIGNNATIGAHSLVREDVPDGAIAVGCPAKIISK